MSIKVNLGDYKVIFSESFIITHENNTLSLDAGVDNGNFKLKLLFEKKASPNDNGELLARIESKIDKGLTLRLFNFFDVEATSSAKGLTRFFRGKINNDQGQEQEDSRLGYYFSFSSQSLSDSNDSILFNLNIATKPESVTQESED